jgi:hypothetical protein
MVDRDEVGVASRANAAEVRRQSAAWRTAIAIAVSLLAGSARPVAGAGLVVWMGRRYSGQGLELVGCCRGGASSIDTIGRRAEFADRPGFGTPTSKAPLRTGDYSANPLHAPRARADFACAGSGPRPATAPR